MTIEKCKDFVKDGYGTWDDTSKPTTYANMYDFMKNQNNIVMNLASGIWQPSTAYTVGAIIRSPNLPAGCVATCTTAGTSGTTEPKWTAYGTTVADGSCKWKVNTDSQDTMVNERNKAIDSMHATITGEIAGMHTNITGERNKAIDDLHSAITKEIANAILQTKKDLYPVGAIFISLTDSRNPADILGFGTWEALPAGYGLVAQGTATAEDGSTLTFTAGQKSGEFKHQLSVGELPPKQKYVALTPWSFNWTSDKYWGALGGLKSGIPIEDGDNPQPLAPLGDGEYHTNVSPNIAVYLWQRTA